MTQFSKKTTIILNVFTFVFVILGTILLLCSNNITLSIQNILETKIFHREFSLEKWQSTILSLISFPIFIALVFNTIVFMFYSDRNKIIVLLTYLVSISVLVIFCLATKDKEYMDSDMASEILLAKECLLSKSFWPRSWNYSTEIRLLNTQLISAPLFLFTTSWHIVKLLTSVLSCAILFFSQLFLLKSLGIKKTWLKLLVCIISVCPFSVSIWTYNTLGNYYIPHIVLSFVYLALFFYLGYSDLSKKKKLAFEIMFFAFAFLNGVATIRYLIIFEFPLVLAIVYPEIYNLVKNKEKFSFKAFFIQNKKIFYSVIGFIAGCIGYVFNMTVLSSLYSFSDWNTTTLKEIGTVPLFNVYKDIFNLFGYSNDVSVLTPTGLCDLGLYVFLIFLVIGFISFIKNRKEEKTEQNIFMIFTLVSFIFTGFLYIKCDYVSRYFIMELAFVPTCVAILIEDNKLHNLTKYILSVAFAIVFLGNTYSTCQTVISSKGNSDKKEVLSFLEKNNYDFGYATFWNANVFTYLSNGKIEVANLDKKKVDGDVKILNHYSYDKWLTPNRYYTNEKLTKKCFLLVSNAEYNSSKENNIFTNGQLVFNDDYYKVFTFDSVKSFKESF